MREEEDDAVTTSNGMNDDDSTNIYSNSDFDNNRIGDGDGDDNCNLNQKSQVWGTWEELVLTSAVERHGFTDWDSVAKEIRSRSSLIASAGNCRLKYQDLKRRFRDSGGEKNNKAATEEEEDGVGEKITWLEQLRSLRVAELRREVQRCDESILSLQLKVKKLEEEKDGNDGDKKPDLENDETKPARLNRETTESDRSMNESNSTASVDKTVDHEPLGGDKTVKAHENSRNPDPDPVYKAATAAEEEEEEGTVSKGSGMSNSGELDESGTSTGPGKRKRRKIYRSGDDSSIRGGSGGDIKSAGNKSQPLIDIIKLIRSHPRGSVFESRLRSQETKNYKSLIRQHLDIKTIEKKLEKGSYVSSNLSFYRDLKLLFANAIVFFPPSSSESMAAHELRTLVSNEMKKQPGKSGQSVIKAEAESSVSRPKSSVLPLVVCKKKSSVSKKTSSSASSLKQKDEKKQPQEVSEEKKTVTITTTNSARSSRRTSKGIDVVVKDTKTGRGRGKINNKKQTDSKTDSSDDDDDNDEKEETPKAEKKIVSDKKKSAADFLKRIKKNSPQKAKEATSKDNQKKKSEGNVKKDAKPRELRSNSTGKKKVEVENNSNNKSTSKRKQPKKEAEEVTIATGKRGRESGKDNKQQPKKRSRR